MKIGAAQDTLQTRRRSCEYDFKQPSAKLLEHLAGEEESARISELIYEANNGRPTFRTPFGEERLAHTSKRPPGKAAAGKNARPTVWAALGNYFRGKDPAVRDARACDLLLFLRRGLLGLGCVGRFRDGLIEQFLLLYGGEAAHKLGITGS